LARILIAFGVLVAASTFFFSQALGLRLLDALYFVVTTVTSVGYGDIALRDAPDPAKVMGMVLMFAGAAFLAVLYALFTSGVVARRLRALAGRVPVRARGHVVVVGAGNIGFRVARALAAQGHRVVVVERDPQHRHVETLRAEGHHVLVADALVDETLDLAGAPVAGAVLALTESDATNLHVALTVRRRNPGTPIVMRLGSVELSAHVTERGDARAASPVALASEAFARAALEAAHVALPSAAPASSRLEGGRHETRPGVG
jgi:voltage-gated potassium channel Kch